jgi:1-acyl-sn-glycerol-3-phosphate acyltransferase
MTAFRSGLFNVVFYGLTTLMAISGLPLLLGPRRWTCGWRNLWIKLSLWCLTWSVGLRHEVRGLEHLGDGQVLVAAQHQSAWETLALHLAIDDPALALKRELYRIPLFGWYLSKVKMAAIDRSGGASALKRMVTDARRLADAGRPLLIFPQGTRVSPGTKAPYLPGVFALYKALGRPCVPVALNSGFFWGRAAFTKRPGTITLAFLEPIAPGLSRAEFMTTLETRIETTTAALAAEASAQLGK